MVDSTARCPAPEVLAAYIDRGLSLAERSRVDRHLASCPQCVALVARVVRTVADVSESMPHGEPAVEFASRAVTRRTLVGVLAAAAAVIAVLFSPSLVRLVQDRDTQLVNLVGVSEQRSVLGRLTGGFPHAPLGVPSAGGQGGRAAETDRILLTAARIRESFGERETPSRLHELGVAQLLAGRYDESAQALLAASREQPANARYLNDLATVQLERARSGQRPDDLPRALASAERARRLDPSLREAWFNRALAITALGLTTQAKAAWVDYLGRDDASQWAGEARSRLADLAQPTAATAWLGLEPRLRGPIDLALAADAVGTYTTEARNFVEQQLLPDWSAAVASGGDSATARARLQAFAEAFLQITGDAIYRDTVTAIDRAEAHGADALRALATAQRHYTDAARALGEDRFPAAQAGFETAQQTLQDAQAPFAVRASIELAALAHITGDGSRAERLLGEGLAAANGKGYAYASARATWLLGLTAFGRGRLDEVRLRYEETLATFERMGDVEQAAAAHNLLAAFHGYLGDEPTAWRHRRTALAVLTFTRSDRLRYLLLATTAAAVRRQDPETSLLFQNAVVDSATLMGRPAPIVEALSVRAALLANLGRDQEAQADLVTARTALGQAPATPISLRMEEPLLAAESEVFASVDPQRAVAAAETALARVSQRGDRLRIAQLSLRLARANIAMGRQAEAEAALSRGIQAFDAERSSLSDESRISTLDESWELFDTAVQLAIRKQDYPRAFALSEHARARTIAELHRAPAGRTLADVEQSLQPGDGVVALNQFDNELAVWLITPGQTTVVMRPLTRRDAQRLVARQAAEIRHEARVPDAGADLFTQLLRPLAPHLAGVTRLSVVPDAVYQDASFAGLWDAAKGRFLAEQVIVSTASSVGGAVARRTERLSPDPTDPLIFGGPGASATAQAVAAVYAQPDVLIGSAATRSRFIAEAPSRSIVHVSAPAQPNAAYPLLSSLMLSDEPGRRYSGALLGRDLTDQSTSRTRLVVIDNVSSNPLSSEGSLGVARAFIAAGVPAVVGTLPGANEAATRELMVVFHRLMSTGITADEALNRLQRTELQNNGHRLGAWCALVLYGSDR